MNGELKNLLKLLRQLICQWSFDTWRDAQVQRTFSEQLRTCEELRIWEEQEKHEKLALMALKILAVRALLRNLAVRAQLVKHLACERASLPLIF